MRIAFLYPALRTTDALADWISVLARHTNHDIFRAEGIVVGDDVPDGKRFKADVVFILTQGEVYSTPRVEEHMAYLIQAGIPFGVIHNQDTPGVPPVGHYPSFVWTEAAQRKLAHYAPKLVRQPVLPSNMVPIHAETLHLATFGCVEEKKHTRQMAERCQELGIPFTVFAPETLLYRPEVGFREQKMLADYRKSVRQAGATFVVHPWYEKIESIFYLTETVSHFLFVLPPSKGGSGGSPTSPRYATAFGKPVIVVDDEGLFQIDGFYVLRGLHELNRECLADMKPPSTSWGPQEYVDTLVRLTKEFWA